MTFIIATDLFKVILESCDDNTGKYVNQGTYGLGLSFKIADSKQSPISHITLDPCMPILDFALDYPVYTSYVGE
mgnify:CR=1 FL=1